MLRAYFCLTVQVSHLKALRRHKVNEIKPIAVSYKTQLFLNFEQNLKCLCILSFLIILDFYVLMYIFAYMWFSYVYFSSKLFSKF